MPPLRIGFNPDFAPLSYCVDDEPLGPVVDRTVKVVSAAGYGIRWRPLELPRMLEAVSSGDVDAVTGVGIAGDRHGGLVHSRPLVATGGAWFVLAGTDWHPGPGSALRSGEHRRVITPATGPLVGVVARLYPDLEIATCRDYGDALLAVVRGEADAAALNWHVGRMRAETEHPRSFAMPDDPFMTIPLAIVTTPGEGAERLRRIDRHIPSAWSIAGD